MDPHIIELKMLEEIEDLIEEIYQVDAVIPAAG